MILNSLKSGLSQIRARKRFVMVFYLANLFFGLLMMWPLRGIMKGFIGNSTMGEKLGGALDMDFLLEFFKQNSQVVSAFSALMLIVPLANWLFTLFLSGGAFAVFAGNEKYSPAFFWGNAVKYFGRFCRLVLWSLPVFAILFCLQFIETGLLRLIFGADPYQNITYWEGWIKVGLRAISFLLCGMILDYARIHAVLTDERKMLISLIHGIKFSFGHFLQTFGLALLILIVGAIALTIYNPIADSLAAPNALVVFVLFILQQVYMIFRMTIRLTSYASQLELYRQLATAPATITSTGEQLMEDFVPAT